MNKKRYIAMICLGAVIALPLPAAAGERSGFEPIVIEKSSTTRQLNLLQYLVG